MPASDIASLDAGAHQDHPEIEAVLDELRTHMRLDGADLKVISLDPDGLLKLRAIGRSSTCPMAFGLLQRCLEKKLKERIPAVKRLEIER